MISIRTKIQPKPINMENHLKHYLQTNVTTCDLLGQRPWPLILLFLAQRDIVYWWRL